MLQVTTNVSCDTIRHIHDVYCLSRLTSRLLKELGRARKPVWRPCDARVAGREHMRPNHPGAESIRESRVFSGAPKRIDDASCVPLRPADRPADFVARGAKIRSAPLRAAAGGKDCFCPGGTCSGNQDSRPARMRRRARAFSRKIGPKDRGCGLDPRRRSVSLWF